LIGLCSMAGYVSPYRLVEEPMRVDKAARQRKKVKTEEYLRRMHPDYDYFLEHSNIGYKDRCSKDAEFTQHFPLPPLHEAEKTFKGHSDSVDGVAWVSDTSFATGAHDKAVRFWDVASGSSQAVTAHEGAIFCMASSPNDRLLVSGGDGSHGQCKVWDPVARKVVGDVQGHRTSVFQCRFAKDSSRLVSVARDGRVLVHDAGNFAKPIFAKVLHNIARSADFCHMDPALLATCGQDGNVQVLDLRVPYLPYEQLAQFSSCVSNYVSLNPLNGISRAHSGYACGDVQFLRTDCLLSCGKDNRILRWNLSYSNGGAYGACAAQYLGHSTGVRGLAMTSNGSIVSCCEDGSLRSWGFDDMGVIQRQLQALKTEISSLNKQSDAAAKQDEDVSALKAKIVQLRKEKTRLEMEAQKHVTPTGHINASAALVGHSAFVAACSVRKIGDADHVVTASWDQTAKLFVLK